MTGDDSNPGLLVLADEAQPGSSIRALAARDAQQDLFMQGIIDVLVILAEAVIDQGVSSQRIEARPLSADDGARLGLR